ncbi:MAG TPA: glycoside hydrolase family 43 protein [Gemmatimonadaceae bacterium]|nr:glycoside hydrolase family 43 protein [Gemmatimonadaceae bacterium]
MPSASSDPRFEWFEYRGDDSVYRAVRAGPDEYLNPILPGFYPDPSLVRVGGDYYLVASSFAYFPGVPIFHSRDLVSWTQLGHVLDRPSQLDLDGAGISRGIFAPAIQYHAGTYYMITTLVDRGGNFLVTATDPAGPWSDPVWLREIDGIDPSLFFDDDGRAYVVNNGPPAGTPRYEGHRAIWMQEYDAAAKRLVGPREVIVDGGVDLSKQPIWIEAPHIFKRNGRYYLICAEGGTGYEHSEVVFRGDSPRGPYVPHAGNPILTQRHLDRARPFPVTSTGHADFVETPAGEWWAVFLGVRPYGDDLYNTGRETFLLPVRWVDDWPVILAGEAAVPYANRRPALPAQPTQPTQPTQPAAPVPTAGNFVVRDDFDGPALAPYWVLMRTPRERWYDLATPRGALTLRARPVELGSTAQPSFVGRRQQHASASATAAMRYVPAKPGDEAGLVAFQNEAHYYALGVTRAPDGGTVVQLERRAGGTDPAGGTVVASAPVRLPADAPLYLRIQARGGRYDFYYGHSPNDWTLLRGDLDGTILSTRVAGGFVGTMLGMYAYAPGR